MDKRSVPSPLGPNLKSARQRKELTQAQAADKLGVALRTVQSWEYGDSTPVWGDLAKAARVYGTTVAALYEPSPASGEVVEDSEPRFGRRSTDREQNGHAA